MSKKVDIRPTTKHLVACEGDHAAAWVLAAIEFATKIGGWKGRQRLAEACMVDRNKIRRIIAKLKQSNLISIEQTEGCDSIYTIINRVQNEPATGFDMNPHEVQNEPATGFDMNPHEVQNEPATGFDMNPPYNIDENIYRNIIGNNNSHTQSACEGLTDIEMLFAELKNDLQNATQISEDAQRNFKKTPAEILAALDEFQRMQRISGVTTDTRRNYRTHFNNWMYQQFRLQNQNKRNNNNGNNNNELPARLRVSKPSGPAQSTCDF